MTPSQGISVIIPHHNRCEMLPATLDSVLGQSMPPSEVIVVDDHSSEDLSRVIERYKNKVIFLKNNGHGACEARNTGFHASTGELIQFFDSDDLMTCNKLEAQAKLLNETGSAMVHGPYVRAMELQDGTWKQMDAVIHHGPINCGLRLDQCVLRGWSTLTQSCLFRRDLFEECGLWRPGLVQGDDIELLFRIGKVVKKPEHENESCVIYRQHGAQLTEGSFDRERMTRQHLAVTQILRDEARAAGYTSRDRIAADLRHYHNAISLEKLGITGELPPELDRWYFPMLRMGMRLRVRMRMMRHGVPWSKRLLNFNTDTLVFDRYLSLLHSA